MPHPAPTRRPRRAPVLLAAALGNAALLSAACGGGGGDAPTAPTPTPPVVTTYTAATRVTGTLARSFYRDTLLAWEREVFYWDDRVNWTAQQASVRAAMNAAATHGQLWAAAEGSIEPWFRDAGDEHSAYFPPTDSPGVVDSPSNSAYLVSGTTLAAAGAPSLAYLYVPTYSGINETGRVDSTQAVIRTLDEGNPCGWVLDLRFNPGGNIHAMLAGINPIFGDAPASATAPGYAGLVDRYNGRATFYVRNGQAGIYDPSTNREYPGVRATTPYTLRRPNSPVAVLTGPTTASAGELITLGYRGGPVPNRSFGEPTYGVTTVPFGRYLLPDSGYLNITAAIMFDRTGRLYGGKVAPDEPVAGGPDYRSLVYGLFGTALTRTTPTPAADDAVLNAATAWLRRQPACTGAAVADRTPAVRLLPGVSHLPGEVRPNRIGERVSKYLLPRSRPTVTSRPPAPR